MAIEISEALRNAAADAATALFDGGTGLVNIYTGTQPADPATAASGTLLATLTLDTDAADPAVAGVATFNAIIADTVADASGLAGWFRIYNSDETAPGSAGTSADARLDGTCGEAAEDLVFDDANIVAGGAVNIQSFSVTMPGA